MSKTIRYLSSRTINQIAAGEVIENPASVVKELVENSIDAGARRIVVETFAGGFQLIQVSDDGAGMSPEDAALAIERHATSKLKEAEDLFALTTMGFRGEALASIASISKVDLTTAAEGLPSIKLEVEGGSVVRVEPAARARGTTIAVRSLFFNVPARKKFQKSATASSAEMTRTMTQLALAHPDVGFELIQQERVIFSVPSSMGGNPEEILSLRARALLGEEFFLHSLPICIREKEFELIGFVAKPDFTRPNRSGQSLFINRRPIGCPSISYAMRDAYGTRLDSDRHPVFLLHFTIDPSLVDVNVHPQKKEVRLREESHLKYRLHSGVNEALAQKEQMGLSALLSENAPVWPFSAPSVAPFEEESIAFSDFTDRSAEPELNLEMEIQPVGIYSHFLLVDAAAVCPQEHRQGLIFFDLPAVEAAVCFEGLLERHAHPLSQRLLFPMTLVFSKEESEWLLTGIEEMIHLGLEMHQVGDGAFMIEAIPPFLKEEDVKQLLLEMIGEMQQWEKQRSLHEKKMASLARTLSQRARRYAGRYQKEEAVCLVKSLLKLKNFKYCPRGKPTLHYLEDDEINAFFRSSGTPSRAVANGKP